MNKLIEKIKKLISVGDVPAYYWRDLGISKELEQEIEHKKNEFLNLKKNDDYLDLLMALIILESASSIVFQSENDLKIDLNKKVDMEDKIIEKANEIVHIKNKKKKNKIYEELKAYISSSPYLFKNRDQLVRALEKHFDELKKKELEIKKQKYKRITILFGIFVVVTTYLLAFIEYPLLTGSDGPWAFEVTVEIPVITEIVYVYTPTVDPAIANMPTPVPTSIYSEMKYDLSDLHPAIPDNVVGLYLIDDKDAIFNGNWEDAYGSGIGNKHKMLSLSSVGEDQLTSVNWIMDNPIMTDGLFEIFVLDPLNQGGFFGNEKVVYEVADQRGGLVPISGINEITQLSSNYQTEDLWQSLGIYDFEEGSVVSISVDIPVGNYHSYSVFGADAILISKLADPVLNQVAMSMPEFITEEKSVLFVLNDEDILKNPEEEWLILSENENRWGTASGFVLIDGNASLPSLTYTLNHALLEGKYELWTWVDAVLSVPIRYSVDLKKVSNNLVLNGFVEFVPDDGGPGGVNIDPAAGNVLGRAVLLGSLDISEPVMLNINVMPSGFVGNSLFATDALIILNTSTEIIE